ncbi:MAG: hypothetical protein ACKV2V_24160 [Blastocatellia bacterium]
MTSYVRAEIEGNSQNCAHLINQLLNKRDDLLIDQYGFLLVPAAQWDDLQQIAARFGCGLVLAENLREAA